MLSIVISIYSIFIVFFLSSAIKNLVANSNGYARKLRVFIFLIVFGYLIYVAFLVIEPIEANKIKSNNVSIVSITTFFLASTLSLSSLVVSDFKRASVRDEWKYNSSSFKNFKTDKPKSLWSFSIVFVAIFLSVTVITMAVWVVINTTSQWIYTANCILVAHILINYLILGLKRKELRRDNLRYNMLKKIIINHPKGFEPETLKEVGTKALELYKKMFVNSRSYKNNVETNNAIIYEIIKKTSASVKAKDYFRDMNDPSKEISQRQYEKQIKGYKRKNQKEETKIIKILNWLKRY